MGDNSIVGQTEPNSNSNSGSGSGVEGQEVVIKKIPLQNFDKPSDVFVSLADIKSVARDQVASMLDETTVENASLLERTVGRRVFVFMIVAILFLACSFSGQKEAALVILGWIGIIVKGYFDDINEEKKTKNG